MADNSGTFQSATLASPPAGLNPALRQLTLSGDTAEVQVIVPIAVTGSEGAWTGREYLIQDDAAFTPGTNAVAMFGAEFDDSSPDSVDEGDAGALRMSGRRELYVQIRDAAGNERGLNVDSSGNITVNVTGTVTVGSHAVTNAGTFAVQVDGSALTALQKIDDPVLVDDAAFTPATSSVMMMGAEFDDSSPDSVDEGDAGAVRMSGNRNLYVRIRDNAGNERGLNIDANGALAATVTNATASNLKAEVVGTGTFVVQENGAALTALQLIDDGVFVDDTATHSTGTSKGYGMMAVATPTDSAVDANDFGHLAMTTSRRLHVSLQDFAGTAPVTGSGNATGALRVELANNGTGLVGLNAGTNAIGKLLPPDIDITTHTNYAKKYYTNAGAVTDGIVWSPAAGKRWHVVSLYVQVSTDATVTFEDDKAGGDEVVLKGEFKAGSGVSIPFSEKYPLASGEDAADLLVTTSAGNIYITVTGYEI